MLRFFATTITLALHFLVGITQGMRTFLDDITTFGPLMFTLSVFLTSLLFGTFPSLRRIRGDPETGDETRAADPAAIALAVFGAA